MSRSTKKKHVYRCLILFTLLTFPLSAVPDVAVADAHSLLGRVCGSARPGHVRCDAVYVRSLAFPSPENIHAGHPISTKVSPPFVGMHAYPPGGNPPYGPVNIETAYSLPQTSAHPAKIAIVTAYDDPKAESDLAHYRTVFGLGECTAASGCFSKVNQRGIAGSYPTPDASWSQETSLDLDMVSAVCRNCSILLVEADSTNVRDLGVSVNIAVRLGATIVSNSYGTDTEDASTISLCNSYYNHYYVTITASAGDTGINAQYPAVCPGVVAVGGTSLQSTGVETVWGNSGGGCSRYIAKPLWQSYVATGCGMRATADVSALADPTTGFYIYDTYQANGFYQAGGTSASAPLIAGIYGLAGNTSSLPIATTSLWAYRQANAACLSHIPSNSATAFSYQGGLGSPRTINCF